MKLLELFEENINEQINNYLYHLVDDNKAIDIFETDILPASWTHDLSINGINYKKLKGTSFTRNSNFSFYGNNKIIKIIFDKDRLKQSFKIYPLDAEKIHGYTIMKKQAEKVELSVDYNQIDRFKDRNSDPELLFARYRGQEMAEEFLVGDIKNLHCYIKGIIVFGTPHYRNKSIELYDILKNYCKKYKIFLDSGNLKRISDEEIRHVELVRQGVYKI